MYVYDCCCRSTELAAFITLFSVEPLGFIRHSKMYIHLDQIKPSSL